MTTSAPRQGEAAQPAPREEHYRPTDSSELLEARTCLAELLVKIAGELLEDSIPRSTAQLITDTRDTVVHAQALIDAIDRKLERMQKAARAIRAMYRQRATGRGRARDRQP